MGLNNLVPRVMPRGSTKQRSGLYCGQVLAKAAEFSNSIHGYVGTVTVATATLCHGVV